MFATRNHNENAIYEQQTAAAAKPLNQGLKGLAPKTPGVKAPKTPFKVSLNDENANFGAGKTGGKAKQAGLFGDNKTVKADRNAFVTPAGPRTRAPLGNKTTNAKAFQTANQPTQEKLSAKPTSPRMRRAKVHIHQAVPVNGEGDVEERDIERMPPREIPLPDHPEDWPLDRAYPQFAGKNLTKGWLSEFQSQKEVGDDLSDFEENLKKADENERKAVSARLLAMRAASTSKPSTVRSRNAASALTLMPSFAAPTTSTRARLPSALGRRSSQMPQAPAIARHNAAKAASNTTLGYSKGRAVSAGARAPLSSIYRQESEAAAEIQRASPMRTPFGNGTTLDSLLNFNALSINDEADDEDMDDGLGGVSLSSADEEDELEEFRLASVEL